jgi:hypothetical protein
VLVFHGTGGDRALVDKICAEGLVPTNNTWAHDTTGIEAHVFACTTPVGSRGGDPIHFAQRRAYNDRRAYLFVLDVPPSLVRGAVPNGELEQYWFTRTFAEVAFDGSAWITGALIEEARERRCAARELLAYHIVTIANGLCKEPPTPHTLVQFERAYVRARTRKDKQRVAASYGLTIPDDFANDSHSPWCEACMGQLFHVQIAVVSDTERRFHRGSWTHLDPTTLGAHIDALDRWLAAHGDPRFRDFATLQRDYPPPRDRVPRTMWPDFVTADLPARMKLPDTQLLLDHVTPEHIVGAIDIGDDDRLSPLVRPHDGEVLLDKLWYLARQLVERRRSSSTPVIVD